MPFIDLKTSAKIDESTEALLREKFGKIITLIPGKSESWLMLSFSDNLKMYFKGDDSADTAYIDVKIFGKAEKKAYDALTKEICRIYSEVLSIPGDRIYVKYEEADIWGWNGMNF